MGMSRNGWLRIIPSHNIQLWSNDTAHRLFYALPAETAFDVETRVQMRNNDSSCLSAGLFIRGGVNSTGSAEGDLDMEWLTIGVLDFGDDALLQWNAKAEVLDQAIGLKARDSTSEAFLRMVRDGDGGVRAFWKRDRDSEWTPTEPKVYFDYENIELGLYAADCGTSGNATVDFEYFRDNVKSSFTRTFHHKGGAGLVMERSGGAAGEVMLDDATGDDALNSTGPAKTLAGAVTRAASLEANATVLTLLVAPGKYPATRLDAKGAQQVMIRGNASVKDTPYWTNASSSAAFVTTRRFDETFGEKRDTMMWNGTAWVPAEMRFKVKIAPDSAGLRSASRHRYILEHAPQSLPSPDNTLSEHETKH